MEHNIFVKNKDMSQKCLESKNLMDGLKGFCKLTPKGCHNGACGVCRVQVLSGKYETKKMNRVYISEDDERNNILLACRVYPLSDMEVEFLPKAVSIKTEKKVYAVGH